MRAFPLRAGCVLFSGLIVLVVLVFAFAPMPGTSAPATAQQAAPASASARARAGAADEKRVAKPAQLVNTSTAALDPYLAALRPGLAGDVNKMATWPRYDLALKVDPQALRIEGTQQVVYTNRETAPLKDLALRLYPNTEYMEGTMSVSDLAINGQAVSSRFVVRNGRADRSMMVLTLPKPLAAGQQLTLSLALAITAPFSPTKGYRTFGLIDGILSLPNAYAMIPPREQGKWHLESTPLFGDVILSEMALYRVRIQVPKEYRVVATGVCVSDAGDGAQVCSSGPARDFAFHLSQHYQVRSTTIQPDPAVDGVGGAGVITVYSYYTPEHARAGERALDYASAALKTYERRFGPYPYRELKVFETTTIAGGIEYPMLAGVTNTHYDLDGGYFEWLVAHEVAHQWWYNLVGSNPITEAWLDESLTQYSASLYIEDRYGDVAARAQREMFFNQRYDAERKAKGDRRVGQASALFPRWSYFPIVYGKGPLFFEEVRRKGDDARFEAWLRTYFARNRYGIANADGLLRAATDVGLGDIARAAYDRWIMSRR